MSETRKVFDWVLYVKGIYGRNRTEKRTNVRIFRRPEEVAGPDDATLDAAIVEALNGLKLRYGRWYVERNPVELETYSDGVTIEKFLLFSGEVVASGRR